MFLVSYVGFVLQVGRGGMQKCASAAEALMQAGALSKTTKEKPGGSLPPKNKHWHMYRPSWAWITAGYQICTDFCPEMVQQSAREQPCFFVLWERCSFCCCSRISRTFVKWKAAPQWGADAAMWALTASCGASAAAGRKMQTLSPCQEV